VGGILIIYIFDEPERMDVFIAELSNGIVMR